MHKLASKMKLYDIPYAPVRLLFYSGDEREDFDSKVRFDYPEWEDLEDADGMHFKNHIYIEDITETETVLHELSHFLDWLYDYMEIQEEPEFRACILSQLIEHVLLD